MTTTFTMDNAALKMRLRDLKVPIGPRPVVYIDLPVHLNVGDLLINAGAEQLFHDLGMTVDLRLTLFDADRLASAIRPEHVIVLHGGGNFGDIWPRHQMLRERFIARFPNNRIIVFPQSVHYNDAKAAEAAGAVLRQHRDLHVFVRDHESRDYLRDTMAIDAELMPDTAHQLFGTLPQGAAARDGRLLFLRRDKEASDVTGGGHIDWDDLVTTADKAICGLARAAFRGSINPTTQALICKGWYARRDDLIARSSRYFDRYALVETSRLHGAILAQLLGVPVVPRDNYYGKIHRYMNAWQPEALAAK
ncbi:polysaccharide pyruvyl transferase family protein [Sphingomonas dokdonensis]|uniref:Putative pyruvyl transferase EpsO n=1 Tax=Sphingomonas dokdonensis TaxID=344880 RepID=A0A245ZKY3_9SPHN|nr:polysaccharide pyruvyl transferase family protein [Sphingomonas dokdonensis]OWK30408.1 putative pyruvyl transferase EpsO [Sphingomonas dokdonensis]